MIDGWIVRASISGSPMYLYVKGYMHPDDGLVVAPYRLGSSRLRITTGNLPSSMILETRHVDCIGWPATVIKQRDILEIIDPYNAFKFRKADLPRQILELVDLLGVEVGLTGSWAINAEGPLSDVDLIIAPDSGVWDILRTLEELREKGLIRQCRDRELIESKVGNEAYWLIAHYRDRLLESCFKGYPYTIRLLRYTAPKPCSRRAYGLGYFTGMIEIVDAGDSCLVPARYKVRVIKYPPQLRHFISDILILESWRTRYQELPPGFYIVYNARLTFTEEGMVLAIDPQGRLWPADPRGPADKL